MGIVLGRKWKLKNKLIKQFTVTELAQYNHNRYERDKNKRLQYQKNYYENHKEEIKKKANDRYRIKCGLGVKK